MPSCILKTSNCWGVRNLRSEVLFGSTLKRFPPNEPFPALWYLISQASNLKSPQQKLSQQYPRVTSPLRFLRMRRLSAPVAQVHLPRSLEIRFHRGRSSLRRPPQARGTVLIHGKRIWDLDLYPTSGLLQVPPKGPRIATRTVPPSLILAVVLLYASVSLKSGIFRHRALPPREPRINPHHIQSQNPLPVKGSPLTQRRLQSWPIPAVCLTLSVYLSLVVPSHQRVPYRLGCLLLWVNLKTALPLPLLRSRILRHCRLGPSPLSVSAKRCALATRRFCNTVTHLGDQRHQQPHHP